MTLRPRRLVGAVQAALADTPVVVVNGARQVGKTTLVHSIAFPGGRQFVTLDEATSREAAALDPRAFLERSVDTLVIDEVQLEPALFRAIKAEVDRDRRPGRFLLTGSSRLLGAPGMADALVGRVETLELWPFSQGELHGSVDRFVDAVFEHPRALLSVAGIERSQLVERVLAGGFPEAVRRKPARRRAWFDSYVTTVNQSVIRELAQIERLAEIPRLLRLCAARTATELNVTNVAAEFGIPARTLDGYLALLVDASLVQLVPSWSTNLSSKVVRRPKLVLIDSGLAAHLLGASADLLLRGRSETFGLGVRVSCPRRGYNDRSMSSRPHVVATLFRSVEAHERAEREYWRSRTPAERLGMMWQLTLDTWAFAGDRRAQLRLPRHVVRVHRAGR